MKSKLLKSIAVIALVSFFLIPFTVELALAPISTPTVWVKIYRIQKIDPIESIFEFGADWRYKIYVWNGEAWSTIDNNLTDNIDDIIVDTSHEFEDIKTSTSTILIDLLEDDFFGAYEIGDISSREGVSRFQITYNLKDNTLNGDEVVVEGAYYKTSGDYDGSVSVDENDANLWFTIWDNYDAPIADAGIDKTSTLGDKVNFDGSGSTASGGSSIVKYEWDFENDGIIDAEGEKTSYTYTEDGVYTCWLRITDSIGESDVDTCIVTVKPLPPPPNQFPIADFTSVPADPTIQNVVSFVDQSSDPDGSITSWLWNFGDGTTSEDTNPEHQYSDKGTYTVTLTVTDNDEAQKSTSKILTVINRKPEASFTFSPTELMVGDHVQFTDDSTDPEGKPLSWSWNFGDGDTSPSKNPTHKYQSKGTYEVTLTVTDDEDSTDVATKTITVLNKPPTASFTYTPSSPTIQDTVKFSDTSQDSYGSVVSWFWDFGDETNSTSQNPSHVFGQKGQYTVALTVTDNDGAQKSATHTIIVHNLLPNALFNYTPASPHINTDVQFNDKSTDPENMTLSWHWDFGDGYTSDLQNPTHNFASKGEYSVTLTVTDDEDAVNIYTTTVSVTEPSPAETSVAIPLWMILVSIAVILALGITIVYVWNRHRRSPTA